MERLEDLLNRSLSAAMSSSVLRRRFLSKERDDVLASDDLREDRFTGVFCLSASRDDLLASDNLLEDSVLFDFSDDRDDVLLPEIVLLSALRLASERFLSFFCSSAIASDNLLELVAL